MNRLKTVLLLSLATSLLLAAGAALGRGWLLGAYFWSHKLVLRLQQARELPLGEAPSSMRTWRSWRPGPGCPRPGST
jgi:hypothetical protein